MLRARFRGTAQISMWVTRCGMTKVMERDVEPIALASSNTKIVLSLISAKNSVELASSSTTYKMLTISMI